MESTPPNLRGARSASISSMKAPSEAGTVGTAAGGEEEEVNLEVSRFVSFRFRFFEHASREVELCLN